jgi:uncharacterized protein
MHLEGEYIFAAPRPIVWEALQDPKVLASVLPGCERLDLVGPDEYDGKIKLKIGPVQGDYQGKVKLTDLVPPESFRMQIDGKGQQGFVKATANITLADEGLTTKIAYSSDAQVGGRIATVGQRLIETSARAIVKQSLDGLDVAMRARAEMALLVTTSGGSVAEAAAAAAAVAPRLEDKPSQADFAASVAKEVARDLVPGKVRRALIVVAVLVLTWFLLGLLK